MPMSLYRVLGCLPCFLLFTQCGSVKPEQVERGTISVKATPAFGKNTTVHITVYAPKGGKRGGEVDGHNAKADEVTGFVLPIGPSYEVVAFADLNNNGKQDPGEPSGQLLDVKPDPDVHQVQAPLVLIMTASAAPPAAAADEEKKEKKDHAPSASSPSTPISSPATPTKPSETAPSIPIPPPPKP